MKYIIPLICLLIVVIDVDYEHGSDIWYAIKQELPRSNIQLVLINNGQNGLLQGIGWAVTNRADVICIPLVTSTYSRDVERSIIKAGEQEIKIVAPLWNKDFLYRLKMRMGINMDLVYPACYPGVIKANGNRRGNSFASAIEAAGIY